MCNEIINIFNKYDTDMIMFGYEILSRNEERLPGFKCGLSKNMRNDILESEMPNTRNDFSFSWRFALKKEFIEQKSLLFNKDIKVGEDYIFNISCMLEAKSVYILHKSLYVYNDLNTDSIMRKKYKRDFHRNLDIQYKEKLRIINKYKLDNDYFIYDLYHYYIFNLFFISIKNIFAGPKKERYQQLKELLNTQMCIDSYKYFNIKKLYKSSDNFIFFIFLCLCKYKIYTLANIFCMYFYSN